MVTEISANVKIGNTIIDKVNSTKLLGINVDNTLSCVPPTVYSCSERLENTCHYKPGLNIMIIMLNHSLNIVAQFGVSARKKIRLKSLKSKRKQQDYY